MAQPTLTVAAQRRFVLPIRCHAKINNYPVLRCRRSIAVRHSSGGSLFDGDLLITEVSDDVKLSAQRRHVGLQCAEF
jgi:hypothetical protein